MDGFGIIRGLGITLKHFFETFIEDIRGGKKRYFNPEGILNRRKSSTKGIFTVQYPEEKLTVPEEFRFIPFLVYEEGTDGSKNLRCTACGICSKVCPTQCIWIVRSTDATTGKPIANPQEFNIDIDACMNCGTCAEFCPFDAIKMDHDYEIATYERAKSHIYDKEKLAKPISYYKGIRPVNYAQEEADRAAKEAAKQAGRKPPGPAS